MNCPKEEGAAPIAEDIQHQQLQLAVLHIDQAYVKSPVVDDVLRTGGRVFSKPWGQRARSPDFFSKRDFKLDLRAKTIRRRSVKPGQAARYPQVSAGANEGKPLKAQARHQTATLRRGLFG